MNNEILSGKVLVAVPYHQVKDYCIPQLFEVANALTYKNKEVILRVDPSEYGSENAVKKQREYFRKLCLAGDFEYLYFLGADTIPPVDVLERMLRIAQSNNIKVIGGVYWGRHDAKNGRPEGAVAWINEMSQEEQTNVFSTENTLLKIDGMGMDCVLIHREVLEKISWLDWEHNDDDYPFYDKAKSLGYDIYIDTSIQCKHYFKFNGYTHLAKVVEI